MGGDYKFSKDKLNHTLTQVVLKLNEHNIDSWFIAYGTLLGIIRDGSCIDNDDDIDIIVNKIHFCELKKILKELNIQNYTVYKDSETIVTTHTDPTEKYSIIHTDPTEEFSVIDFYIAHVYQDSFYDRHENVTWGQCFVNDDFIKKEWNSIVLNIPNHAISKLIGRYGRGWKKRDKNFKNLIHKKVNLT